MAPRGKPRWRSLRRLGRLYKLVGMEDRVNALEAAFADSEARAAILRDQVDMLKSSQDVPPTLVKEFAAWKAQNPIPSRPLVSVCVATYNRARLLTERCVRSVLEQTYDNLELIVVGDACSDGTVAAMARIQDPRLTFINLDERGVYPADPALRYLVAGTKPVNTALALAQGDYITHLDDDDAYTSDRLARLVQFAHEQQADFVWHPFWFENPAGQWILNEAPRLAYGQITTSSVFYRGWFTRLPFDPDAYRLLEPGDWNRFRRMKYLNPVCVRYPQPLLKHYREKNDASRSQ